MKILIVHNKSPDVHDLFTLQCKNICKKLNKRHKFNLIWLIYPPAELPKNFEGIVLNIKNYKTSLEVINKINPDFILINGSLDFHNVELALVSKFKKIPIITIFKRSNPKVDNMSPIMTLVSRTKEIFSNKVIAVHKNEIKAARINMLGFYKDKYTSLIRILKVTKHNKIFTIKFVLNHAFSVLINRYSVNKSIEGRINLCVIPEWKKILIKNRFKKESIFVIGDPYLDNVFTETLQNHKMRSCSKIDKKKILFCTSTMHEHGFCSKKEEYQLIRNTVNEINKGNKFDLIIKIHPSSSSLTEYKTEVLDKISLKTKIYQIENLLDLINECDVLVSYGGSGSILYGIILKKPVLNLNFKTNPTKNNIYSDGNIIYECKNIKSLEEDIDIVMSRKNTQNSYNNYLTNFVGISDGNSSQRAADIIFNILKKHND